MDMSLRPALAAMVGLSGMFLGNEDVKKFKKILVETLKRNKTRRSIFFTVGDLCEENRAEISVLFIFFSLSTQRTSDVRTIYPRYMNPLYLS